jgi:hypothetical protein
MKTIFCDIDGTLLPHTGNIIDNLLLMPALPGVVEKIRSWDRQNYKIILTTGRKESTRAQTELQLRNAGIVYDQLIMGLPNGDRILINDRKTNSERDTAYAINVTRNAGLNSLETV